MDKKTEKTINVIIISLVVLLFLLIFNVYFDKTKDHYMWEGPAGDFEFNVDSTQGITFHLLKLEDVSGHKDNVPFEYGPKELEYISYDGDITDKLVGKELIYITQNPEDSTISSGRTVIASLTVYRILNRPVVPFVNTAANVAITQMYEGYDNQLAIVNCDDVSETQGVVLLKQGFSNSMYLEGDCVVLEFVEGDSVKVATAFVYRALGVL
ncbi:hypothetical protein HOD61_02960 [archaeon]|jgi:hypothetical protein|nr:hypothetical protein [archaeon]